MPPKRAAAAAAAALAPAAAESFDSEMEHEDEPEVESIEMPFDINKNDLVLDVRALTELPCDPDASGIQIFPWIYFREGQVDARAGGWPLHCCWRMV